MKLFYIGFFCCLLLSGCPEMDKLKDDPNDATLRIINGTSRDILFCPSFSFPDTSLNMGSWFLNEQEQEIALVRSDSFKDYPRQWKLLLSKENPDFRLMIFLFEKSTLETTPWDTIVKKYLVLKRYDLSLEDLEKKNWTITYP
jgi:hypothetical protein